MYDNWLDSIEKKMGERFRFAVEMTVKFGLRALAVVGLVLFSGLALISLICSFSVSATYILLTMLFIVLDVLSLFLLFLAIGEDW